MAKKKSSPKSVTGKRVGGISAVSVCGYKSICKEQRVEFRPLTLLAGANSSGKSSIMQPLLLLKQTLEASYDPGALLLDGPNVRFTSASQLFCKLGTPCPNGFSVKIDYDIESSIKTTFVDIPNAGMEIQNMFWTMEKDIEIPIYYGMTMEKIRKVVPKRLLNVLDKLAYREKIKWTIEREKCFLCIFIIYLEYKGYIPLMVPGRQIARHIEGLIHLPGLRGNPARDYPTTSVDQNFPGTFEKYIASVIHNWQVTKSGNLRKLKDALKNIGLAENIVARRLDDTKVELRVSRFNKKQRNISNDLVSIADVGFGVSQVLPVLVALIVAQPGQLVYLEQPEIHLHPRAQKLLAHPLADAAKRGVTVVVETHSALLLRGIQTLIAKGSLNHKLVKLHWFERDKKSGATVVSSADPDELGGFGKWPEDFDEVTLEAEGDYLDAVEKRTSKS